MAVTGIPVADERLIIARARRTETRRTELLEFSSSRIAQRIGYVMQGDTAKAKAAYQDFLTLWKDADPDISILKQAKAEYAKVQ
jgi:hypothetical protein